MSHNPFFYDWIPDQVGNDAVSSWRKSELSHAMKIPRQARNDTVKSSPRKRGSSISNMLTDQTRNDVEPSSSRKRGSSRDHYSSILLVAGNQ